MAHAQSRTNSRISSRVQSQLTLREMVTLRDGMLPVITGREPGMSGAAQNIAERLSDTDKRDMVFLLMNDLIRTPRALHEVCDEIIPRHESLPGPSRLAGCSRRCQGRSLGAKDDLPPFGRHKNRYHDESCPWFRSPAWSRRYQFSFQLLPFLNKTVEIVFGATFQGGGFHIEPPLRVYPTVRRLQSPIFSLFDNLPKRCTLETTELEYFTEYSWVDQWDRVRCAGWKWDLGRVRLELANLPEKLAMIQASGRGSIRDKDESGQTLLVVRAPPNV